VELSKAALATVRARQGAAESRFELARALDDSRHAGLAPARLAVARADHGVRIALVTQTMATCEVKSAQRAVAVVRLSQIRRMVAEKTAKSGDLDAATLDCQRAVAEERAAQSALDGARQRMAGAEANASEAEYTAPGTTSSRPVTDGN
jgi:hypothetical protein